MAVLSECICGEVVSGEEMLEVKEVVSRASNMPKNNLPLYSTTPEKKRKMK
jgi:hypothetical protein